MGFGRIDVHHHFTTDFYAEGEYLGELDEYEALTRGNSSRG